MSRRAGREPTMASALRHGVQMIELALFLLAAQVLTAAGAIAATAQSSMSAAALPLHVYATLDNSWSMTRRVGAGSRMDSAISAAVHWAASLAVPSSVTVELLTASDRVDLVETFSLRSETDRAALIDAIRRVRPVRGTQTMFSGIDRGLADIVKRDTGVGEDFGIIFLSDAVSDTPATDLRAEEIGDHTMNIGGGVYAVTIGPIPGQNALARHGGTAGGVSSASRSRGAHASVLRALRHGAIRLNGRDAIAGMMPARLFGGHAPLRTDIEVDNTAGVARLVRFDVAAPGGLTAVVMPNPLAVPAGRSAAAKLELSAPDAAQGQVTVIARLPDGRTAQQTMYVQLTPGSWIAGNVWLVTLPAMFTVLTLICLMRWMRRAVRIGDHADTDRQAALAIGDSVPLDTFLPGATGGLRRGWFGYQILADGQPVSVSGRMIQAGSHGRYRLGEDLRVGDRTVAIFRTDTAAAATADDFAFASFGGRASGGLR